MPCVAVGVDLVLVATVGVDLILAAAFGSGYGTSGIGTLDLELRIVPMSLTSALNFGINGLNSASVK